MPRIDHMIAGLSCRVMMMAIATKFVMMVMVGMIVEMMLGMTMRKLFIGAMRRAHAAPAPQ